MSRIAIEPGALKKTRWYEYLVRFAFGGAVSAAAGAVGHFYGALVGGLFLAFPALLPASLTLVKKHAGRSDAADDAAGAACGAIGLIGFAGVVWISAGRMPMAIVLSLATALWFGLSYGCWRVLDSREPR